MKRTIEIDDEDLRAFAVLCEIAEKHPRDLEFFADRAGVKPEWFVGLMMKLEL